MKRTGTVAALALLAACGREAEAPQAEAPAPAEPMQTAEAEAPAAEPAPGAPIAMDTSGNPAERFRAESEAFLAQNAGRPDVTVTASGLQYEVLAEGPEDGESPTLQDWVCVHYSGALIDGSVFDSTEGGPPLALPLSGLIDGWREGLPLMSEGDSYRLFVPSDLGYGPSGAADVIPPNAALVFDLTLERVLGPSDIAVLPDRRVDPDWNCAEEIAADEPADAAGDDAQQ